MTARQLTLFEGAEKDRWYKAMVSTIEKFYRFYPSEVKLICMIDEPNPNLVGPFYKNLISAGKIRKTGTSRSSPRKSRHRGREYEYETGWAFL